MPLIVYTMDIYMLRHSDKLRDPDECRVPFFG